MSCQAGADVVGVEHRILRRLPHAVGAMREHPGKRAHEHAHLPVEGAHAAERFFVARIRRVLDEAERLARRATTKGTGANGASASDSTTGPAPGPPPPCGVENVLCRLMCMASTPSSPGFALPMMALRLAPSQ